MKRRLSVAISLIGAPLVAYLDEPSTGLDPSSRRLLWDVIKKAKKQTAIVLTTHSMEEAEALCDRLGIFVNGQLRCVGNPKVRTPKKTIHALSSTLAIGQDLTARYGSYLQFSVTSASGQEETTAAAIYTFCRTARPVYSLGGTQKFELPTEAVQLQDVFAYMEQLKNDAEIDILDWGVSNTTLEEVFIKITNDAGVQMTTFA